ncbi:beta strand repeat-containing protein [Deinococcus altitudinis]|uniref:beta strand repeat-containing protein n=1 Tax=Deinococcus altitudinis TaxID=468914 RepID=UPI0038920C28
MFKLRSTAAVLTLLPALLLGACGQSTVFTPTDPPVAVTPITASLTLQLFIPTAPSGQGLAPQYISSATTSLRVQLGSIDTTLALSAANCTPSAGGQTCTFKLNVAPGTGQSLTVSAYDASSRLLSTSTGTANITAGQDNTLTLTLTGVAASATLTPTSRPNDITAGPSGSLLLDLGGSYTIGTSLRDAAGQTILNPGRPTETVTSSNPAFTVSSTGVGTFSVVAPDPSGAAQTTTLTVRDAGGSALVTQVLTVPAEKVTLALSNTAPAAGSSILATARLTSARGQALNVAGRTVTFGTTDGSFPGGTTASTDATGTASVNVLTGTTSGTTGTVSATESGVTTIASYTSVAGTANTTSSTVVLSPNALKVNGTGTLTVTLKDSNNNPVTTPPSITVTGNSIVGAATQNGNVFTYPVTAAAAPETATFTVSSGGNTVGSANLAVSAYALTVSDGAKALSSGSSQYDFQNGNAHSFTVAESNYTGAFTATSSNTAAAKVSVTGGVLTVTPKTTAGFSTITVSDSFGQSFTFTVSVTTASLVIN